MRPIRSRLSHLRPRVNDQDGMTVVGLLLVAAIGFVMWPSLSHHYRWAKRLDHQARHVYRLAKREEASQNHPIRLHLPKTH